MTPAVHPGEYLTKTYLVPLNLSGDELQRMLGVPVIEITRLIRRESFLTAELALRLEAVFAKPAAQWLQLQMEYDVSIAREHTDVSKLTRCARLNEVWLTGIPAAAGSYFWREGPNSREHRVEMFYEECGSMKAPVFRCYSMSDISVGEYARGQWRRA